MSSARYDGIADWFDANFAEFSGTGEEADFLAKALGDGNGRVCLDVACGTGLHAATIVRAGYVPVGIDISADQLRFAQGRLLAVRGNARRLPVASGAVDVAVGMYFHTDVEDFDGVVSEVARCLSHGGRLIYVGLHPSFIGPFVNRTREIEDRALTFVAGYGRTGWETRGSGGAQGLWSRVGGHHKSLAEFMGAFAKAPLTIRSIQEFSGGGTVLPRNLGVLATVGPTCSSPGTSP
jgi:SAM-dependent methyltransferase